MKHLRLLVSWMPQKEGKVPKHVTFSLISAYGMYMARSPCVFPTKQKNGGGGGGGGANFGNRPLFLTPQAFREDGAAGKFQGGAG